MLKEPWFDEPFQPSVSYFLGGIEIYDREHTLGEELWKFNPNDKADREFIIRNYILCKYPNYTYRHRYILVKNLKSTLENKSFDFAAEFETDFDNPAQAHTSIAWDSSEIDTPKSFFEDIYRIACDEWKDEIEKAEAENQAEW